MGMIVKSQAQLAEKSDREAVLKGHDFYTLRKSRFEESL